MRRSKHHFLTLPGTEVDIVLGKCVTNRQNATRAYRYVHVNPPHLPEVGPHPIIWRTGTNGFVWISRALCEENTLGTGDEEGNLMSAKIEVRSNQGFFLRVFEICH